MPISMESSLEGIRRACAAGLVEIAPQYDSDPGVLKFSNHVAWQFQGRA